MVHYILTYLLACSMVQSRSWAANRFAASQEIPRISRSPKVQYRTHKRPPPVSILGQPNPVHIPTSHLLENHPNIIHPSMSRCPQWSPSIQFPQHDPIHPITQTNIYTKYILIIFYIFQVILHVSVHLYHLQGVLILCFAKQTNKQLPRSYNKIKQKH